MDFEVYILWIIIAAIAGIAHLVRKAIEKMSSDGGGKKINLAEAVHKRIRRYMDPLEAGRRAEPLEDRPSESDAVARAPRLLARPVVAPEALPGDARERRDGRDTGEARTTLRKSLRAAPSLVTPPPLPKRLPLAFDPEGIRKAILMAEILGPPVSERENYRLF